MTSASRPITAPMAALISVLCATAIAGAGVGTWGPSHGPWGGDMTDVALDPSNPATIYASAEDGSIFKSTSAGRRWRLSKQGQYPMGVNALVVDPVTPTTVYAGTQDGVLKTTDGGGHWLPMKHGLGERTQVSGLAIAPSAPATLYAAAGSVFKSTDGGASWHALDAPSAPRYPSVVLVHPRRPSTVYVGTGEDAEIVKTTDGGRTWQRLVSNLGGTDADTIEALAINPRVTATVYASTDNSLYRSTDSGRHWRRILDSGVAAIVLDGVRPAVMYVAALYEPIVFKTTSGGRTWRARALAERASALVADQRDSRTVYAATRGDGVFATSNAGAHWRQTSTGITGETVAALAVDHRGLTVYATTDEFSGDGVRKSVDGGLSWRYVGLANEDVGDALAIHPRSPEVVYVGTGLEGRIFKSANGGRSWQRVYAGPSFDSIAALVVDPDEPSKVYGVTRDGAFLKSSNAGRSWRRIDVNRSGFAYGRALVIDPRRRGTLYVGSDDGAGVWKSTNGGRAWSNASKGLTDGSIEALAFDPRAPAAVFATTDSGIFETTDGGGTWRRVSREDASVLAVDPKRRGTLYAGTEDGVLVSSNRGRSWQPLGRALRGLSVPTLAMAPSGRVLYAGPLSGSVVDYRFPG